MSTSRDSQNGSQIRLFGTQHSSEGFILRDFLQRSVVAFEWVELETDHDVQTELGFPDLKDKRLPTVIMPGGNRLYAPSVQDLANRLGWVTKPKRREYDVTIYGAGPAGLSAAVYAASEGLHAVLIERYAIGGQAGSSSLIENYMGFPDGIPGAELAERGRQQAVKFGVEILMMREGVKATFDAGRIKVDLADGSSITAKSNICATGVEWRRLGLPEEPRFLGRGFHYGAGMSEAPLCRREHVYVVGGANSAGQAAMYLANYADRVTMVVRGAALKATMSNYLSDRILSHAKIDVLFNTEITKLGGGGSLERVELTNRSTSETTTERTNHVFVAIGGVPNTDWSEGTDIIRDENDFLVTGSDLMEHGRWPGVWHLKRPPFHLETSVPGSFAVGDVRHGSVKRVATAVGEGSMAVSFVHAYLAETQFSQH